MRPLLFIFLLVVTVSARFVPSSESEEVSQDNERGGHMNGKVGDNKSSKHLKESDGKQSPEVGRETKDGAAKQRDQKTLTEDLANKVQHAGENVSPNQAILNKFDKYMRQGPGKHEPSGRQSQNENNQDSYRHEPNQQGPHRYEPQHQGPKEEGTGHHGPSKDKPGHHRPGENGPGHHGPSEGRPGHHGPGEDRPGHRGPGQEGGEPGHPGPFGPGHEMPPFLANVTEEALQALIQIVSNENITKAEMKIELQNWATAQGEEIAQQFEELLTKRQQMEEDVMLTVGEIIQNVTDFIDKVEIIRSNMEITREEERIQIAEAEQEVSPAVVEIAKLIVVKALQDGLPLPAPHPELPVPEEDLAAELSML